VLCELNQKHSQNAQQIASEIRAQQTALDRSATKPIVFLGAIHLSFSTHTPPKVNSSDSLDAFQHVRPNSSIEAKRKHDEKA
jgi:hypothetical protein